MFEQTRHELLRELDMDVLDQQSTTQLQEEYKQLSKENVRISCSDFFLPKYVITQRNQTLGAQWLSGRVLD